MLQKNKLWLKKIHKCITIKRMFQAFYKNSYFPIIPTLKMGIVVRPKGNREKNIRTWGLNDHSNLYNWFGTLQSSCAN